mmetsp:Transcript_106366/g.297801  ORF Transcript_106366/g.297801 Transcript_106366/m.297801 type:complete len:211 (-) Transcript_106366:11-643(-)
MRRLDGGAPRAPLGRVAEQHRDAGVTLLRRGARPMGGAVLRQELLQLGLGILDVGLLELVLIQAEDVGGLLRDGGRQDLGLVAREHRPQPGHVHGKEFQHAALLGGRQLPRGEGALQGHILVALRRGRLLRLLGLRLAALLRRCLLLGRLRRGGGLLLCRRPASLRRLRRRLHVRGGGPLLGCRRLRRYLGRLPRGHAAGANTTRRTPPA